MLKKMLDGPTFNIVWCTSFGMFSAISIVVAAANHRPIWLIAAHGVCCTIQALFLIYWLKKASRRADD